jgi:Fe-S cluster biosynthesis and repair protein YggX
MPRTIYCFKLNQEAEGLDYPPMPGELGKKIYENISKAAWQQWINHQTMLINEYRLNLLDDSAKQFLRAELEKFLFGTGSEKPAGYVPASSDGKNSA